MNNPPKQTSLKCNIHSFKEALGEKRSKTLFIALRRYNLGEEKMCRGAVGNKYVKNRNNGIKFIIIFDLYECMEYYQKMIKNYTQNGLRTPNKKVLSCYNKGLKDLQKIQRILTKEKVSEPK